MSTFILIGCFCFVGGLVNGATGFGSLLVMVPMLLMVLDMHTAIPLGVLCVALLQFLCAAAMRSHVCKRAFIQILLSSLPGIGIGTALLWRIPELYIKTILGFLFCAYALWCLTHKQAPSQKAPAAFWAFFTGFCSGTFGGAFGISGPPVIIYATRTGWPPQVMRGTISAILSVELFFVLLAHFIQNLLTAKVCWLALYCVPLCLLGSWLGYRYTRRLRDEQYMRLVLLLILVMGVSLCLPALRLI